MNRVGAGKLCIVVIAGVLGQSERATADVSVYDAFSTGFFSQVDQSAPTTPQGYVFAMRLISQSGDAATAVVVGPLETTLLTDLGSGFFLYSSPSYLDETQLRAAWPAGPYTHTISGGILGDQSASLEVPTDAIWPGSIPAFTPATFDALVDVDSSSEFTIEFNGWKPGVNQGNLNVTFVTIFDGPTGAVVFNDFYPNTTTTVTLPPETLIPSRDYFLTIYYSARFSFENAGFGTATSIVGFDYATTASMRTRDVCRADFNSDGEVNSQDFFDFLNAFFAQDLSADVNADKMVNSQDFFDFLGLFFAGC